MSDRPLQGKELSTADTLQTLMRAMARNAIRMELSGAVGPIPGATRFGGVPDVPPGFEWPFFETATYCEDEVKPRPLAFLAQFNCAELAPFDRDGLLPHEGLLSFFYELGSQRWGFDPGDAGCARVFWFREPVSPAAMPPELPEEFRLPAFGIGLTAEDALPHPEDLFCGRSGPEWEALQQSAWDLLDDEGPEDRSFLLGWPDIMQGCMTVECELVRRGHYTGSGWETIPEVDRREASATSTQDWLLLMQLSSRDDWMFGDCGRIYFYIRREDLAARHFDRVWLILQCG